MLNFFDIGFDAGRAFIDGLAASINAALPDLAINIPGATAPVAASASTPAGAATGGALNISISGNTFGSRSDVDYLLNELERRLGLRGALRP